ncbi:MAG: hypothetical protein WD669_05250 [Pirellulales bacterium]
MSRAIIKSWIGAALLVLALVAGGLVSTCVTSLCGQNASVVAPTRPASTPTWTSPGQAASDDSAVGAIGVDADVRHLQFTRTLC